MSKREYGLEVAESADEEPAEHPNVDDLESELADLDTLLEEIKNDLEEQEDEIDETELLYERMEEDHPESPYGSSGCPMCNLVDSYTGTVETPRKVEQLKEAAQPETHTHDQTCSYDEYTNDWLDRYRNRIV